MVETGSLIPQGYVDLVNQAVSTGFAVYDAWKARQAHPLATEWVAAVQDPFGSNLEIIVNAKDALAASGMATADDIYFAKQAILKLWAGYQEVATRFAVNGPLYSQVIENSYKTLNPLIQDILKGTDQQIAQLGGISSTARLGVNLSHFRVLIVLGVLTFIAVWVVRRVT